MIEEFGIYGTSPGIRQVVTQIKSVAPTDAAVAIIGETGTGKELVAQAIHKQSRRSDGPFVAVNCGAVPKEDIILSELFGHERGSFTGASSQRIGFFEEANYGTIFLDEVNNGHPRLQNSLLRVLESGHFRRVGGTPELKTNARIISASSSDLNDVVREKLMTPPLMYRLKEYEIRLPPLRERRDDIGLLAEHFLGMYKIEHGIDFDIRFDDAVLRLFETYHWPGNVRELRALVGRAVIDARGISGDRHADVVFGMDYFEPLLETVTSEAYRKSPYLFRPGLTLAQVGEMVEREFIVSALRYHGGNITQTAEAIGTPRNNLYKKIEKYDLSGEGCQSSYPDRQPSDSGQVSGTVNGDEDYLSRIQVDSDTEVCEISFDGNTFESPVEYTFQEASRDFRARVIYDALERHKGDRASVARELSLNQSVILHYLKHAKRTGSVGPFNYPDHFSYSELTMMFDRALFLHRASVVGIKAARGEIPYDRRSKFSEMIMNSVFAREYETLSDAH